MDHHDQLINYIRQHLQQGASSEHIKKSLIEHGWQQSMIDDAFKEINMQPAANPRQTHQVKTQHDEHTDKNIVAHKKYTLAMAAKDTVKSVRRNPDVFVKAILISAVFLLVTYGIFLALMLPLFMLNTGRAFILAIPLGLLVGVLTNGVIISTFGTLLAAGAEDRSVTLGQVISAVRKNILRVGITVLYSVLVIYAVILIPAILPLLLGHTFSSFLTVFPFFIALAAGIATIVAFNYILSPLVALFEPAVPIRRTLSRSKQLMKGGKWFLLKCYLIFLLVILISTSLTSTGAGTPQQNPFITLLLILLMLFGEAMVVMLYRNQRALCEAKPSV